MAKRQYNKWRELEDGTIEIELTQGKVALIDKKDMKKVLKYKWCVAERRGGRFYAVARTHGSDKRNVPTYMHRLILGAVRGQEIDHIDHDGANNRRDNLRFCNANQNHANQQKYKTPTSSKYKGVSRERRRKAWRAYITIDNHFCYLGQFATEEEAARAYNVAALEHFGEFALLNELPQ